MSALKSAATSTGHGIKTLYRLGEQNSHFVLPLVNGLFGDKLAAADDPMAIRMRFRLDGKDVSLAELDLENRLQGTGRDVTIMVHGHGADEVPFIETPSQRPGYGTLLKERLGVTVLYVRYNTGLHISENGRALSDLLKALNDAHGLRIRRLILVGHSMGGLVVRSAGYYGHKDNGAGWTRKVTTVLLIGSPVMGSYLEQFANLSAVVLKTIVNFHTRLIGQIIDERSNGIKDMRHGAMVDEDWDKPLPRTAVPLLPDVDYHVLVGTLSENDASPLALFFGDGMVGKKSAMGQGFTGQDDPITERCAYHVFPGSSHYDTVLSPQIGEKVVDIVRRSLSFETSS